jgi:hypothetical protein
VTFTMTGTPAPVRVLPQAFPDGVGCGLGALLTAAPGPGPGTLDAPEAAEQPAVRQAPRPSMTAGTTAPRRRPAARLILT